MPGSTGQSFNSVNWLLIWTHTCTPLHTAFVAIHKSQSTRRRAARKHKPICSGICNCACEVLVMCRSIHLVLHVSGFMWGRQQSFSVHCSVHFMWRHIICATCSARALLAQFVIYCMTCASRSLSVVLCVCVCVGNLLNGLRNLFCARFRDPADLKRMNKP